MKKRKVENPTPLLIEDLPARDTEVEAYEFIRAELRDLEWVTKDPSRHTDGQVWTQNQCLAHPQMKAAFGRLRPENVVKLNERAVWVIEAKRDRKQLEVAVREATEYYADKINATPGPLQAHIATGVAGNEESGYLMQTKILVRGAWRLVTVNKQEATGLLSASDVRFLLESGGSDVHDFSPSPWLFIHAAERINAILHHGGINKNDRAKTMAALLLSVIHEPPNLDTSLPVLIGEINARSRAELTHHDKPEFAPFVEILPPTNTKNHVKFKSALVRTILALQTTYRQGQVAYVTNGFGNNGVLGFVTPNESDTVHAVPCIAVSAFCEATVQIPPFIARGNGGSGLIVLEPIEKMSFGELAAVAASINAHVKWRFSWSRQVTVDRLKALEIPEPRLDHVFNVAAYMPATSTVVPISSLPDLERFALKDVFDLHPGDFHNASDLPPGLTPLISCGDRDNGVAAMVRVAPEYVYSYRLTIAFNGMNTLTAKYHPYEFAAKDDVAVCTPKKPLKPASYLFIQMMIRREMWRYNYYRKCFMEKLQRQEISLPFRDGWVDEQAVEIILRSSPYWGYLADRLIPPPPTMVGQGAVTPSSITSWSTRM